MVNMLEIRQHVIEHEVVRTITGDSLSWQCFVTVCNNMYSNGALATGSASSLSKLHDFTTRINKPANWNDRLSV
jgi:hypothetical protein